MNSIDISVVVAVKNEEIHVESALRSILSQEDVNHEIIVIDDGSTDKTYSILIKLAENYPKLKVFNNKKIGKCSAFNFGVDKARGRFVCIFAGDDIMPEKSLSLRYSMVKDVPDDRPCVGLCKLTTMSAVKKLNGHLIPRAPNRGALSGVSPLMNKLAVGRIFPVPEILPNEDTWMELAISYLPNLEVIHSNIIGCHWRLHSGNSINMLVNFSEYNKKITARLNAYALFYESHNFELNDIKRSELIGKINCERARCSGSVMGVLRSNVKAIDKLRALSITNVFFYNLRRRFYGLFSGW
ncbi:MAG: glycosyltransferase family A protein [Burkholderiaceae bacterium]|nr:glycosyltransferase family A protein [Burkholderiaceae bacterium]MDZ4143674.1 glycosyltransferase family A protein [Burkholderiales bacterium]